MNAIINAIMNSAVLTSSTPSLESITQTVLLNASLKQSVKNLCLTTASATKNATPANVATTGETAVFAVQDVRSKQVLKEC